jgi:hypothetical protein
LRKLCQPGREKLKKRRAGLRPAHIISLQRAATACAQQRDELIDAIQITLDENGHLADGDNCTLIALKRALEKVGAGTTAPEGHNEKVNSAGGALSASPVEPKA